MGSKYVLFIDFCHGETDVESNAAEQKSGIHHRRCPKDRTHAVTGADYPCRWFDRRRAPPPESESSMCNSPRPLGVAIMKRPHLTSPDGSHFVFVESYFAGTFTKSEQDFVEACAAVLEKYLDKR